MPHDSAPPPLKRWLDLTASEQTAEVRTIVALLRGRPARKVAKRGKSDTAAALRLHAAAEKRARLVRSNRDRASAKEDCEALRSSRIAAPQLHLCTLQSTPALSPFPQSPLQNGYWSPRPSSPYNPMLQSPLPTYESYSASLGAAQSPGNAYDSGHKASGLSPYCSRPELPELEMLLYSPSRPALDAPSRPYSPSYYPTSPQLPRSTLNTSVHSLYGKPYSPSHSSFSTTLTPRSPDYSPA